MPVQTIKLDEKTGAGEWWKVGEEPTGSATEKPEQNVRLSQTKEFKLLAQTPIIKHSDEETCESLQLHLSPVGNSGEILKIRDGRLALLPNLQVTYHYQLLCQRADAEGVSGEECEKGL